MPNSQNKGIGMHHLMSGVNKNEVQILILNGRDKHLINDTLLAQPSEFIYKHASRCLYQQEAQKQILNFKSNSNISHTNDTTKICPPKFVSLEIQISTSLLLIPKKKKD